jgi:hypothetical protein
MLPVLNLISGVAPPSDRKERYVPNAARDEALPKREISRQGGNQNHVNRQNGKSQLEPDDVTGSKVKVLGVMYAAA